MNVQAVSTAFIRAQPLLDFIRAYERDFQPGGLANLSGARKQQKFAGYLADFRAIAAGLQVRYRYTPPDPANPQLSSIISNAHVAPHLGRLRRINGFGEAANEEEFQHPDHGQISVEQYFNTHVLQASARLRFPDLPCINTGSAQGPVWVPPELLFIEPNQPKRGALRDSEMREMVRHAQRLPLDNIDEIERVFGNNAIFDTAFLHTNASLSINPAMMEVRARILAIPPLTYNPAEDSAPGALMGAGLRVGTWKLQHKKVVVPGNLDTLGVIHFNNGPGMEAYRSFGDALTTYGIPSAGERQIKHQSAAGTNTIALRTALNSLTEAGQTPPSVILIILPHNCSGTDFAKIKTWADTQQGVGPVCVRENNVGKLTDPAFQANLALKFNVKLGGINHRVEDATMQILRRKNGTMVVGANVTHPGVGSLPHCPSAAGVVATIDTTATTYPGSLRLQRSKQEIIEHFDDMICKRLHSWHQANGSLPSNILVYRDGVSDGQFAHVKRFELPGIQRGCDRAAQSLQVQDYRPGVTLVVCGKRHHTRFYPRLRRPGHADTNTPGWMVDGNQNFHPGLVVDDASIRSPYHFEFHLQSHKAIRGTVRSCHYFVIENGMNLNAAELQSLTLNLCWTYATALTPISYAAPAYYADRLCDRARQYLRPLLQTRHPQKPAQAAMNIVINGPPNNPNVTDEEKDQAFCQHVANGGWNIWPANPGLGRHNPQMDSIADTMFYI
jgi:eukaryotic translation initiation factor 2C